MSYYLNKLKYKFDRLKIEVRHRRYTARKDPRVIDKRNPHTLLTTLRTEHDEGEDIVPDMLEQSQQQQFRGFSTGAEENYATGQDLQLEEGDEICNGVGDRYEVLYQLKNKNNNNNNNNNTSNNYTADMLQYEDASEYFMQPEDSTGFQQSAQGFHRESQEYQSTGNFDFEIRCDHCGNAYNSNYNKRQEYESANPETANSPSRSTVTYSNYNGNGSGGTANITNSAQILNSSQIETSVRNKGESSVDFYQRPYHSFVTGKPQRNFANRVVSGFRKRRFNLLTIVPSPILEANSALAEEGPAGANEQSSNTLPQRIRPTHEESGDLKYNNNSHSVAKQHSSVRSNQNTVKEEQSIISARKYETVYTKNSMISRNSFFTQKSVCQCYKCDKQTREWEKENDIQGKNSVNEMSLKAALVSVDRSAKKKSSQRFALNKLSKQEPLKGVDTSVAQAAFSTSSVKKHARFFEDMYANANNDRDTNRSVKSSINSGNSSANFKESSTRKSNIKNRESPLKQLVYNMDDSQQTTNSSSDKESTKKEPNKVSKPKDIVTVAKRSRASSVRGLEVMRERQVSNNVLTIKSYNTVDHNRLTLSLREVTKNTLRGTQNSSFYNKDINTAGSYCDLLSNYEADSSDESNSVINVIDQNPIADENFV